MLWESLVTDGHVRAARVRRVQPWVIVLGLVLIWIGIWIARSGPDVQPPTSYLGLLQERVSKLQQHAQRTVESLPALALSQEAAKALPPSSELAELVETIRKSLGEAGDLPTDEIDFEKMKAKEFWAGDWPNEKVAYVKDGDTYLLGANVQVGSPAYPQPMRWAGVMKKGASGWEYVTLGGGRLMVVDRLPTVYGGQIPLSLEPFLPEEKEKKD